VAGGIFGRTKSYALQALLWRWLDRAAEEQPADPPDRPVMLNGALYARVARLSLDRRIEEVDEWSHKSLCVAVLICRASCSMSMARNMHVVDSISGAACRMYVEEFLAAIWVVILNPVVSCIATTILCASDSADALCLFAVRHQMSLRQMFGMCWALIIRE